MGSLSKFFAKHIDLLVEAFDLDENSNLIELDQQLAAQTDKLVHDLFVTEMRGIMNELLVPADEDDDRDPHRYKKPGGGGGMLTNPVVMFSPNQKGAGGNAGPGQGSLGFAPSPGGGGGPTGGGGATAGPAGPVSDEEYSRRAVRGMPQPGQPTPAPVPFTGTVNAGTNYARAGVASPQLVKGLYSAARNAGFSDAGSRHLIAEINRENSLNPSLIFGSHTDPKNSSHNSGIISWQGDRRAALNDYLSKAGVLSQNGQMMPTQANLDAQFKFMKQEMANSHPDAHQYFTDPTVKFDKNTGTGLMGGGSGYIAWALNDPKYRGSGLRNIDRGYNIVNNTVSSQQQQTQFARNQTVPGGTPASGATPTSGQYASRFDTGNHDISNVNPVLVQIAHHASTYLPDGYRAVLTSGERPGSQVHGGGGTSQHASGNAIDVAIVDPQGQQIPNRGGDTTGLYGRFARAAYHELQSQHPELTGNLRWGGNFPTGVNSNTPDLMHLDMGGDHLPQGRWGDISKQYQQNAKTDNFGTAHSILAAQQAPQPTQTATTQPTTPQPGQQPTQQPAQGAQQSAWTARPGGKIVPVGDSLAFGLGGVVGNTKYAVSGSHPDESLALMQRAAKDGALNGAHVVISGGISNAAGQTQKVGQFYPQMVQAAKDGGASNVTIMGVGPYSHFDKYGYDSALSKVASDTGVNYTGPLAKIAPFRGTSVQQLVHPSDYSPIESHIQKNFNTPTNIAQNTPPKQPTPPPPPDQQMASAGPPPSSDSTSPPSSGGPPPSGNAGNAKIAANKAPAPPPSDGGGMKTAATTPPSPVSSSGGGSSGGSSGSGGSSKMASADSSKTAAAFESRRRLAIQLLRS